MGCKGHPPRLVCRRVAQLGHALTCGLQQADVLGLARGPLSWLADNLNRIVFGRIGFRQTIG